MSKYLVLEVESKNVGAEKAHIPSPVVVVIEAVTLFLEETSALG